MKGWGRTEDSVCVHEGPVLGERGPFGTEGARVVGGSSRKVDPPPLAFIINLLTCRELKTPPSEQCELGHALYRGQAGVCLGLALKGLCSRVPGARWVILDDGAGRALRVCLVQPVLYAWENVASLRRGQESGVCETTRTFFNVISCTIGASLSGPKDLTDSFKETPTAVIEETTEKGVNFG